MLTFFAFSLVSFYLPNVAQAEIGATEKQEIESLIEKFIRNNPKILRDALTTLAQAEALATQQAAMAMVLDDAGDPFIGAKDATLTIYEFSDYNCGYCKRIFPDLMAVLKKEPSVRLVVKEFPILAESSVLGARAAIAAQRQGKFPAFHEKMMEWRGKLDASAIERMAKKENF